MFQNLRASSQLYILHKDNNPYIEYGSVVSVSAPKPKYPATPQLGQFPSMEMVVDITVNIGGQSTNLQGLPAGAEMQHSGLMLARRNEQRACHHEAEKQRRA